MLHEVDDVGVLTPTLNGPGRKISWSHELGAGTHDLLRQASDSDEARAIGLARAGNAFCPGLDIDEPDRVSKPGASFDHGGRRPVQVASLVPRPMVCAINGASAGLGLIPAVASDVRFAAEGAESAIRWRRQTLRNWYRARSAILDATLACEFYGRAGRATRHGLARHTDKRLPRFGGATGR